VLISSKDFLQILENEAVNLNEKTYPIKEIKLRKIRGEKLDGKIVCGDKLEIFFASCIYNKNEGILRGKKFVKEIKLKQQL